MLVIRARKYVKQRIRTPEFRAKCLPLQTVRNKCMLLSTQYGKPITSTEPQTSVKYSFVAKLFKVVSEQYCVV